MVAQNQFQLLSGWPPVLSDSNSRLCGWGSSGKMTFWGDTCWTSLWCNEDRCPEHSSSYQDDTLSSQILFDKSDNTKQTNNKTSHSNSIKSLTFKWRRTCFQILINQTLWWAAGVTGGAVVYFFLEDLIEWVHLKMTQNMKTLFGRNGWEE